MTTAEQQIPKGWIMHKMAYIESVPDDCSPEELVNLKARTAWRVQCLNDQLEPPGRIVGGISVTLEPLRLYGSDDPRLPEPCGSRQIYASSRNALHPQALDGLMHAEVGQPSPRRVEMPTDWPTNWPED